MVKVINRHAEKKLTVAEVFACDSTCILEDGRIAFCPLRMDSILFDKPNKEDSILCFIIDDDRETSIEYIRAGTPATPCDVEFTVD